MRWWVVALLLLVAAAEVRAAEQTPEQTVTAYLTAVKANDFNAAYPLVTHEMALNKSKEEWVKEQQWVMQMAEVKIFEFKVYPGKIEGDKAFVPNVLNSQDKFLNQLGVIEHELYTLMKEDGRWKINQQQIVENVDVPKWFPKDAGSQAK